MTTTPGSSPAGLLAARPTTTARGPAAGFTLIEIMFALVVFAIGFLALALCVPVAANRVLRSGAQTRASSLASEMAEELLGTPYGNSSLTAGSHTDPANPHDAIYFTRWVVEDDQPRAQCKRITVYVSRRSISAPAEARIVIVSPQSGG